MSFETQGYLPETARLDRRTFTPAGPLSPEFIREEQQRLITVFADMHAAHGYQLRPEVPVYPSPDKTVLFVGAQISVWKPELDSISDGTTQPVACPQTCIRLQNKDSFYDDNEAISYNSFFHILGAVTRAEDFSKTTHLGLKYLEAIGIARDRIAIKVNANQAPHMPDTHERLVNTERESYYQWAYGEKELSGEGITFAVRNDHTGQMRDIGNVITISKNDRPCVTEWGFGIQTLLAAKHSLDHPLMASQLPGRLAELLKGQIGYKYVDALTTVSEMARYSLITDNRGAGACLDEYLAGMAYIARAHGRRRREVVADIRTYAGAANLPPDTTEAVVNRAERHVGKVSYVRQLLQTDTQPFTNEAEMRRFAKTIGMKPEAIQAVQQVIINEASNDTDRIINTRAC